MAETGTLYIVATPIGNLDDITHRAVNVLRDVDVVAAEDTRHSQKLLQHWEVATRMTSLHDHNEDQRAKQLIAQMHSGLSVALISDAGTPLISDPGYSLVNQCRTAGIQVIPIPGACAAVAALCASGMPTDQFRFNGFLPVKQAAKYAALEKLMTEKATTVFYESPRRVVNTLEAIVAVLGEDRKVSLAKEMTKTFETFYHNNAGNVLAWLLDDDNHQRGEFVLMIEGVVIEQSDLPAESLALLKTLMSELPLKKAAALTAQHYGLKKNALYQYGLTLND